MAKGSITLTQHEPVKGSCELTEAPTTVTLTEASATVTLTQVFVATCTLTKMFF